MYILHVTKQSQRTTACLQSEATPSRKPKPLPTASSSPFGGLPGHKATATDRPATGCSQHQKKTGVMWKTMGTPWENGGLMVV